MPLRKAHRWMLGAAIAMMMLSACTNDKNTLRTPVPPAPSRTGN